MTKNSEPQTEGNPLWTYKQVAEYLGISESMAKRLGIPCIRIGRLVRFSQQGVREWAEARAVPRRTGAVNG